MTLRLSIDDGYGWKYNNKMNEEMMIKWDLHWVNNNLKDLIIYKQN
jgi:hypothetical protein